MSRLYYEIKTIIENQDIDNSDKLKNEQRRMSRKNEEDL